MCMCMCVGGCVGVGMCMSVGGWLGGWVWLSACVCVHVGVSCQCACAKGVGSESCERKQQQAASSGVRSVNRRFSVLASRVRIAQQAQASERVCVVQVVQVGKREM